MDVDQGSTDIVAFPKDEYTEYTGGLLGDTAEAHRTLDRIEYELSRELIMFGIDGGVLQRAGAIVASRRDLPVQERQALIERMLDMELEWIEYPLSSRAVAYPLLGTVALDEELSASLRSHALKVLNAEAERCVKRLVMNQPEDPPWAKISSPSDPQVDHMMELAGILPLVYGAAALVACRAIEARWQTTLIHLVSVAAEQMVREAQQNELFDWNYANCYFSHLLTFSWLPETTRQIVQAHFDSFLAQVENLLDIPEQDVTEDTFIYLWDISSWPHMPDALRLRLRSFVAHYRSIFWGSEQPKETLSW